MQSDCESEHVVKVVETILSSAPNSPAHSSIVFIVMELCEGGNLRDWMRRVKTNRLHSEIVSAPGDDKGLLACGAACDYDHTSCCGGSTCCTCPIYHVSSLRVHRT